MKVTNYCIRNKETLENSLMLLQSEIRWMIIPARKEAVPGIERESLQTSFQPVTDFKGKLKGHLLGFLRPL